MDKWDKNDNIIWGSDKTFNSESLNVNAAVEDMNKIGDMVALFFTKWYNRTTTDFYSTKENLDYVLRNKENDEGWLHKLIREKFGLEKISLYGFDWKRKDYFAKTIGGELGKKYGNAKTFNVESLRNFLNKKYKKYEL